MGQAVEQAFDGGLNADSLNLLVVQSFIGWNLPHYAIETAHRIGHLLVVPPVALELALEDLDDLEDLVNQLAQVLVLSDHFREVLGGDSAQELAGAFDHLRVLVEDRSLVKKHVCN